MPPDEVTEGMCWAGYPSGNGNTLNITGGKTVHMLYLDPDEVPDCRMLYVL